MESYHPPPPTVARGDFVNSNPSPLVISVYEYNSLRTEALLGYPTPPQIVPREKHTDGIEGCMTIYKHSEWPSKRSTITRLFRLSVSSTRRNSRSASNHALPDLYSNVL